MKLPKEVFVKWEDEGEDAFLVTVENARDHADMQEKVTIGRYELKETLTLEVLLKLTPAK
jgi:hypothetical protein